MKKLLIYDKKTTYMYPSGKIATPEVVMKDYPACEHFKFVIETNQRQEVIYGFYNLAGLRDSYGIADSLSDEEAIIQIEEILNTSEEETTTEPSAEERQAAALEAMASGATAESTDVMNILLTGEEA